MTTEIEFKSVLAPYICGHIEEKRSMGFSYRNEELILLRFDRYCNEKGLDAPEMTKELLDDWCLRADGEGLSNQKNRIDAVRNLALYMTSLGMDVYVPKFTGRMERTLPHIFTEDEIAAFFHEVDSYNPDDVHFGYKRMAKEYPVLFRMLYCCGMRNSEGGRLRSENVDLDAGTLDIIDGKGHKDRRVYMANDLTALCREYYGYLCDELHMYPKWFFPARDPEKALRNTSIDRAFNVCWERTPFAGCSNKPTVHDLRFTFVTDRINEWTREGVDVDVMMPYLEKFLGHKNLQDSYYYYHVTEGLYKSVEDRDRSSALYIPEVKNYE